MSHKKSSFCLLFIGFAASVILMFQNCGQAPGHNAEGGSNVPLGQPKVAKLYPVTQSPLAAGATPPADMVHIQWQCSPGVVCAAVLYPALAENIENFKFDPNTIVTAVLTKIDDEHFRVETILESNPIE